MRHCYAARSPAVVRRAPRVTHRLWLMTTRELAAHGGHPYPAPCACRRHGGSAGQAMAACACTCHPGYRAPPAGGRHRADVPQCRCRAHRLEPSVGLVGDLAVREDVHGHVAGEDLCGGAVVLRGHAGLVLDFGGGHLADCQEQFVQRTVQLLGGRCPAVVLARPDNGLRDRRAERQDLASRRSTTWKHEANGLGSVAASGVRRKPDRPATSDRRPLVPAAATPG